MANEWNVSYPLDHTKIGDVPGEIRKIKDSTKDQLMHEHADPVDGDATGSEHLNGSAVAYVGASTPTNRPDGATALADNDIDDGRLWLDDTADPATIKRWKDTAFGQVKALGGWSPAAYTGGESITFPNGLIMKHGSVAYPGAATTVTFAVGFPNALISANLTNKEATWTTRYGPMITTATTSLMVINLGNATGNTIYWEAKGW